MIKSLLLCFLLFSLLSTALPTGAKEQGVVRIDLKNQPVTYRKTLGHPQKRLPLQSRDFQEQMPMDGLNIPWSLGTPSDISMARLETGTIGVFVVGPKYPGETGKIYDPRKSKSSQKLDGTIEGKSGKNQLVGEKYVDVFGDVTFGSPDFNQTFGLLYEVDGEFDKSPTLDGLTMVLGYGWLPEDVGRAPGPDASLIVNILANRKQKVVAMLFQRAETMYGSVWVEALTMQYGGLMDFYCNKPEYFNLTTRSDAKFAPMAFKVGGFRLGDYEKRGSFTGRLDTGISHIYVPRVLFNVLERKTDIEYVEAWGLNMVQCEARAQLPDLIFTVNGKQYVVSPFDYILNLNTPDGRCALLVQQSSVDVDFVFGTSFLQQYCSFYSLETNQVGLSSYF